MLHQRDSAAADTQGLGALESEMLGNTQNTIDFLAQELAILEGVLPLVPARSSFIFC